MNSLAPLTAQATATINALLDRRYPTAKSYNRTTENVPSNKGTGVKVSQFVTDITGLCASCKKSISDCHMINVTAYRNDPIEVEEYYLQECSCENRRNTWQEITR